MNLFHAGCMVHGHIHGLALRMNGQSNADRRPSYRSGRRPDRVMCSVDSADMQVVGCYRVVRVIDADLRCSINCRSFEGLPIFKDTAKVSQ
jgi:hypothetical protein